MKKLLTFALVTLLLVTAAASAMAYTTGDTYPTEYKNKALDAVVDRWNFYNRECTSFVAWCLNDRNGVAFTNQYGGVTRWGNASEWAGVARGLSGMGIVVDNNPAVGAVAWWSSGHVGWVSAVNGDMVTTEEYNWKKDGIYHTRTQNKSTISAFIHIKDIGGNPTPTTPTFTFTDNGELYYMSETTAQFGRVFVYSTGSIYDITAMGCELYDAQGNVLATHTETPNVKEGTYLRHYFRINGDPNESDICYTLSPGTSYRFRSFVVYGGKNYYSDYRDFTTLQKKATLNVNFTLNGQALADLTGVGDFYITVNGTAYESLTDYSQELPVGAAYKITQVTSYDGYAFSGNLNAICSGTVAEGGTTVVLPFLTSYHVVYNANGGENAPLQDSKLYNIDLKLSGDKPTWTGRVFLSWNDKQDGTGKTYAPGATYKDNAKLFLYAQWQYESGWQKDEAGKWHYKDQNGQDVHGWLTDSGKTYFFDGDGVMVTGWMQAGSDWYYFYADGARAAGWAKIGGQWYYFGASGVMQTGWQTVNGVKYYFKSSGAMAVGWQKIGGDWYYFGDNGAVKTGWQKLGGAWYYLDGSGKMLTDWQKIGGTWYYLASGKMVTGWQTISGGVYFFNGSGAMQTGWKQKDGAWYYLDPSSGKAATGWKQLSGTYYFFNPSGVMQTGWQKIGGAHYYFSASGAMLKGWQKIGGNWYHLASDGKMTTGWYSEVKNEKKLWYWFDASGVMATEWKKIDGKWELFGSDGVWQYTWEGN